MKFRTKATLTSIALASSVAIFLTSCSVIESLNPFASQKFEMYKKEAITENSDVLFVEETSDEYGKYTRTTISTEEFGFTGTQKEVADAAIRFTMLEALDSIALDNPSRWEEWKTNVAPQYISANSLQDLLTRLPELQGHTVSNIIMNNVDGWMPILMRDGGVRIADKRISEMQIQANPDDTSIWYATLSGTAVIYAENDEASNWLKNDIFKPENMTNADGTLMNEAQREEAINKRTQGAWSVPALQDDNPNSTIMKYTVILTLKNEQGSWKITDYNNSFEVNQALIQNNSGSQLSYREQFKK